jgi:hypothetical protein
MNDVSQSIVRSPRCRAWTSSLNRAAAIGTSPPRPMPVRTRATASDPALQVSAAARLKSPITTSEPR